MTTPSLPCNGRSQQGTAINSRVAKSVLRVPVFLSHISVLDYRAQVSTFCTMLPKIDMGKNILWRMGRSRSYSHIEDNTDIIGTL